MNPLPIEIRIFAMTMVIVFVTPIAAQTVLPNTQGLKLQNVTGYVILLVRET
jgi:hypothetical protein